MQENVIRTYRNVHRISMLIGGLTVLLPIIFWKKIPEQIPMHYNAEGAIDNWADKDSLILLFFAIFMLMGVMSIAVYLLKTNMESKYSKEAEKSEMRVAYPIVVLMNLIIQVMFAYIMFCSVTCRTLGTFFLPVIIIAIFVPLVYMICKCGRIQTTRKSENMAYKVQEKEETGETYRTAIDWWLGGLFVGCELYLLYLTIEPIVREGKMLWSMFFITIGISILILPLFGIRYVIYSQHMLVSMGMYGKVRIRYEDIVEVKKTNNPLSSAAMSLRRIQIDYVENGVHRMILISPIKRNTFMKVLEEKRSKS